MTPLMTVKIDFYECDKCSGAGWLWWNELKSNAGHDPTSLVTDDTRYSCDNCGGSGMIPQLRERED